MAADILELDVYLISDLPIHIVGNRNAAGWRDAFKACRNVHSITEDVALFNDDIAEMYTDPQLDALVIWRTGIALRHSSLHLDGASSSIDSTDKLD